MRLVALSDTHGRHRNVTVPDGDVLVFAGDLMTCGRKLSEIVDFGKWFSEQPHTHKILVAGNHDIFFEHSLGTCLAQFKGVYYLQDSGIEINGIKFWGSPYQPEFCNWAFNVERGEAIRRHWNRIFSDTDVLITHGPPYGILDQMIPGAIERPVGYPAQFSHPAEHLGCKDLLEAVNRVKPKVNIFGHIHGSYGMDVVGTTGFHNVSICNEKYEPVHAPQVIDIER